ncbi:MAG: prolipoprotein diacylglyceryl transferase [Alphaproteobacteria bacterium]|nr:prolipoprotein diacylglyceryl transferase [Alphaproteobacteria bacterium]
MAIVIDPISPIAFSVFGLPIRWYALAYITAFVVGFFLLKYLSRRDDSEIFLSKKQLDDILTAFVLGVIIGGRLGYVLFYNLPFFLSHPLEIFALWHGGMSFHGGFLGVIVATMLFARNQNFADKSVYRNTMRILDLMAVLCPIGLGLGRIANFINMELIGRETTSSLGIVFAGYSTIPRHASPIYEAFMEGLILFIIMWLLYNKTNLRKYAGALSGCFCMLYAIFRIICEQFRQPDAQIGFLTSWGLTMGQLLSICVFIIGIIVFSCSFIKKKVQ